MLYSTVVFPFPSLLSKTSLLRHAPLQLVAPLSYTQSETTIPVGHYFVYITFYFYFRIHSAMLKESTLLQSSYAANPLQVIYIPISGAASGSLW